MLAPPIAAATVHRADDRDNKASLFNSGQPLGVECLGCGRRGLAFSDPGAFAALEGDMTRLRSLTFRCTACGGREVELWMFHDREHRERFMERPFGGPAF